MSESEITCRKHPNQKQQPGVCPSCLRERLSRISGGNSRKNIPYLPSTSPVYYYYSSSSSSARNSPTIRRRRRGHQRIASDIVDSIYFAVSGRSTVLNKSRSMAFASRNGVKDDAVNRKKKGGFWSKFLLRTSTDHQKI